MKETPSPNTQAKAYIYLTVTLALLVALAFTWSINITLAYILTGGVLFTAVLTVYYWPQQSRQEDRWKYQQEERSQDKSIQVNSPPHTTSSRSSSRTAQTPTAAPPSKSTSGKAAPQADFKTLFEQFPKEKKGKTKGKAKPPTETKTTSQKKSNAGCFIFVFGFIFISGILGYVLSDDEEEQEDMSFENQFAQGENYFNTNDYVQAIIHYKHALAKNPQSTDASLGIGNAYAQLSNIDSALFYYRNTLALDSTVDIALYSIGSLQFKSKNYEEASGELNLLIARNPSYLDAYQLLGDIYYEQQFFEEAFNYYEQAYVSGQRNYWLCYVSAYLHQTRGNNQIAIDRYKEALAYDSSELDIYKRLGELIPGEEGVRYRERGDGKQW